MATAQSVKAPKKAPKKTRDPLFTDEKYTGRFECDFKFDAVDNNDRKVKLKNIELELFVLQLERDKKLNELLR